MSNSIFLLLFSVVPNDHILCDNFDKVELNHFYDDQGRHVFNQVLWSDWEDIYHRHTVHAWRLVKNPGHIPRFNHKSQKYESLFFEFEVVCRKVTAKYMVESWTQYDVELVDREFLKKELRRELFVPEPKVKPELKSIPSIPFLERIFR